MIKLTFVDETQSPIELDAETIADAVKMAIEQGISLCGVDLKEADLHELDLHGIDASCSYTITRTWRRYLYPVRDIEEESELLEA